MTEVEQPPQNGIDLSANEEDENSKARPADIEQDMREMERRKRVEAIMGSKLFREELERIVDSARDSGNTAGILQQLSDIVGVPASRVGSVYKASNCMMPINDIRGVESMGYAKGEKILRCKLAATFRLLDLYGWTQGLGAQITARLKVDQEYFLVNPYGLLYHEITASSLNKVDMQGHIVEQGTTNFGVNRSHFILHSVVHAARPDIRCAIYIGCSPVVAISSLKTGLLPLTKDACVLGEVTTFSYTGCLLDEEERDKLVRNLGPNSKVMLLTNHGALCCGETIEEAFFAACHIVQACETQLKLLPVGLDNLVLIPEESRKTIYEQSRCPPEDLAKKFAAAVAVADSNKSVDEEDKTEGGETTTTTNTKVLGQAPKWRVGGAEFEALMRMLDNAGYRTGYIYRHPLIKSDPPKPKNDVELPPAVSSLGYLLEEEELFRQGIWKKGVMGKGGDRSRWLNSPNVYQKVEVLETGTPDPKKITKWVAEGSPTHSTPVRIDDPLQFVPVNTNPKEFKRLQQQIKDNRRADKISAGPQSHILEGVTWDEANRIKDATVSQAGDHVVLMGAASKGIIQRGFQHNATVYKAPYAKNPFDNVTDDELNEYKRTVERKKKSIHGEYTDTDFSESEALSSLQTSGAQQQTKQNTTTTTTTAAVSQSEPEDISEHQVMRIETQQAPVPSQPEVVLSDATLSFINGERSHTATNRKPPTGRDVILSNTQITQDPNSNQETTDIIATQCPDNRKTENHLKENVDTIDHETNYCIPTNLCNTSPSKQSLINEMKSDGLFQRQNRKVQQHDTMTPRPLSLNYSLPSTLYASSAYHTGNDNTLDMSFPSLPISLNFKFEQTNNLNSLISPLESSPFISPNRNREETLSYYTTSYYNSQKLNGETSPIYDYPTNSPTYSINNTGALVRLYAKSSNCCTPQLCEHILETLQKPLSSQHQQNYAGAKSSLDLIWNIPFRRNDGSPSITPDVLNTPPPGKCRAAGHCESNSARKSRSPYRTLSHFGFNSPQREPQPDHKHILPMDCKRYVPLRRSVSYEEIFASPRYIDLCENCFEQIVRLKPELMQYRLKLRNLAEYERLLTTPAPRPPQKPPTRGISDIVLTSTDEGFVQQTDSPVKIVEDCDAADNYSAFTSQLEPLIEVEEKDNSDLANGGMSSITNSTFIDKITHMNYSEISNNFINTPCSVTISQLSLEDVEEEFGNSNQKDNVVDEDLCKELENLKIHVAGEVEANDDDDVANDDDAETEEHFVSITEIFEFNNWLGEAATSQKIEGRREEANDEVFNDLSDFMDCEKAPAVGTTTPTFATASAKRADSNGFTKATSFQNSPPPPPPNHFQRPLMDRDERTRRKLEFHELWEDHVRYFENREQVMASASYSDTESAIDETQHTQSNAMDEEPNEEIFPSQSFFFSHKSYMPEDGKLRLSQEILDEEVKSSSSSNQTFNIIEKNSSHYGSSTNTLEDCEDDAQRTMQNQEEERSELNHHEGQQEEDNQSSTRTREHLLFRTFGTTDITNDLAMAGSDGYTNQGIRKFIDDDGDEVEDALPGAQSSLGYNRKFFASQEKKDPPLSPHLTREKIDILEDCLLKSIEKFTLTKEKRQTEEELVKTRENMRALIREATRKENEIEKNNQEIQSNDGQERPLIRYKSGILDICEGEENLKTSRKSSEADPEMTLTHSQRLEALENANNREVHCNVSDNFDDLLRGVEGINTRISNEADPEALKNANNREVHSHFDDLFREVEGLKVNAKKLHQIEPKQFLSVTTPPASIASEVDFKYKNCNILDDFPKQLNPDDLKIFREANTTDIDYFTSSLIDQENKENEGSDEQLNSLEKTILHKIEYHQLNKTEQIFNKIENTIRNKLTPCKLEMLLKGRQVLDDSNAPFERTSTPQTKHDGSPKKLTESLNRRSTRRSRSLTPLNKNSSSSSPSSSPLSKCNRTTSPPMGTRKQQPFSPQRTPSPCSSSSTKQRNFILENIRNAAIPRNKSQVKRLQGNAQAIFCKNPFGPRLTTSSSSVNVVNKSSKTSMKSPFMANLNKTPPHNFRDCGTEVYAFQSKLVRGSPRFWVSMSPSPVKKILTTSTSSNKSNKKEQPKTYSPETTCLELDLTNVSSSSSFVDPTDVKPSPSNAVARVDAEINALGAEIQKIQPRLETYKRKLDDFGNRVAKCARNMDECVATQEEIITDHAEYKENLVLQQYVDNVTCGVQTFSLSETED